MAVDDAGNAFELSPDPLLDTVCPYVAGFKLGEVGDVAEIEAALKPVLENAKIFGVNLYEVGMAETVCSYFKELTAGVGAVRETLKKICIIDEEEADSMQTQGGCMLSVCLLAAKT